MNSNELLIQKIEKISKVLIRSYARNNTYVNQSFKKLFELDNFNVSNNITINLNNNIINFESLLNLTPTKIMNEYVDDKSSYRRAIMRIRNTIIDSLNPSSDPQEENITDVKIEGNISNDSLDEHNFEQKKSILKNSFNSDDSHQILFDIIGIKNRDYCKNHKFKYENSSVRLKHVLLQNNIVYLADILNITVKKISRFKNLGKKSYKELIDLLFEQIPNIPEFRVPSKKMPVIFSKHFNEVINNDFSFTEGITLSKEEIRAKVDIKETMEYLDDDFYSIVSDMNKSKYFFNVVLHIYKKWAKEIEIKRKIEQSKKDLGKDRCNIYVLGLIQAYSSHENIRNILLKYWSNDFQTLYQYIKNLQYIDENDFNLLYDFIKWCSFDISTDIDNILYSMNTNDESGFQILLLRSQGETLESISKVFSVTRERIRQKEKKSKEKFYPLLKSSRILMKIYALRNMDKVLTAEELEEYFGKYTNLFIYLLKDFVDEANYNKELNLFTIGSETEVNELFKYINELPDIIMMSDINKYESEASNERGFSLELFRYKFKAAYKKTGKIYHKKRLSNTEIYQLVVKEYFPNGIKVHSDEEINRLRHYIKKDYGNINLPDKNRAIAARMMDVLILCDRGTYKLKQDHYLSTHLVSKISDRIREISAPVVIINGLYEKFEEELQRENITNKYFFQGIMHELFDNQYYMRRGYLFKDKSTRSMYLKIIDIVKNAKGLVTREDIALHYPGLSEITINVALDDPNILACYGKYLHVSNISFSKDFKDDIHEQIEANLHEKGYIHVSTIYDYAVVNYNEELNANNLLNSYGFYSFLEYQYSDYYYFKRPFIQKQGSIIPDQNELLNNFVYGKDIVEIEDILQYTRDNYIRMNTIAELIAKFEDSYMMVNHESIATYQYIGLTDEIIDQVIREIENEVSKNTLIRDLKCPYNFPIINVPWNEWLIYTLVEYKSKKLEVGINNKYLKVSSPLVAPKGKLDTRLQSLYRDDNRDFNFTRGEIDLDDFLDDLLEI